jgi:hypothetical protein
MRILLLIFMLGLAISTGSFAEEPMHQDEYGRWVNSAGGNLYGDSMANQEANPMWNQDADPMWNSNADPNWNPNADPKWNSDADPMK